MFFIKFILVISLISFQEFHYVKNIFRRFVSETFVLWDTFFYDGGVTGNSNINNWDNYNSRYSINVQSDGTLLTNTNASLYAYLIANNPNVPSGSGSSSFEFNYPLAIELDIVDANDINKNGFNFEKSSDNRFAFGEFYASIGDHLKVVYDGATLKSYLNNSSTVSRTIEFSELSDFRLSLYSQVNSYLKFKNFKVYSI